MELGKEGCWEKRSRFLFGVREHSCSDSMECFCKARCAEHVRHTLSIPGALYVSHLAVGLHRINADNLWPWLARMMALGFCAAVAAKIPARRAASINPVDALRTE